jgi:hypothetical protein
MIRTAREERFEIGVASVFSRNLVAIIEAYGNAAVSALEAVRANPHTNSDVGAECLRWLPFVRNPESYKYRLLMLRAGLMAKEIQVRDAATMALAYLQDPSTLDAVELAIDRETCRELLDDLKDLRATLAQPVRGRIPPAH